MKRETNLVMLDLLFQQAVALEASATRPARPENRGQIAPCHLMASKHRTITEEFSMLYKYLLLR
jgi:hypothetical protein